MRYRSHHHPPALGKVNVTPLIDVVMVLIVFYLIVGRLAMQRQAPVDLPESRAGVPESQAPAVVITVAAAEEGRPRYLVEGEPVPAERLGSVLRTLIPDPARAGPVHVRADRRLPYAGIEPVVRACREAGLPAVKLVAERGGGGGS